MKLVSGLCHMSTGVMPLLLGPRYAMSLFVGSLKRWLYRCLIVVKSVLSIDVPDSEPPLFFLS